MTEIGTNDSTPAPRTSIPRLWSVRYAITNAILLFFAGIAAYLEYSLYPLVMTRPLGSPAGLGFGETNVSLKFSFLTFQYIATRCMGTTCTPLVGIPAFDFFQVLIIALVVYNVMHFINFRSR